MQVTAHYVYKDCQRRSRFKNIRDATEATTTLSFAYLGVDALCIIQDSEGDEMRKLCAMQRICGDCTLTIDAPSTHQLLKVLCHIDQSRSTRPSGFQIFSLNLHSPSSIHWSINSTVTRARPSIKGAGTVQEQLLVAEVALLRVSTLRWQRRILTCNRAEKVSGLTFSPEQNKTVFLVT